MSNFGRVDFCIFIKFEPKILILKGLIIYQNFPRISLNNYPKILFANFFFDSPSIELSVQGLPRRRDTVWEALEKNARMLISMYETSKYTFNLIWFSLLIVLKSGIITCRLLLYVNFAGIGNLGEVTSQFWDSLLKFASD